MEEIIVEKETKKFRWSTGHSVVAFHMVLAIMVPIYFLLYTPSLALVAIMILLFMLSGLGVTAGYHRCYAHRSYQVRRVAEVFIIFCASLATQGSIIHWAHDHRIHHRFTDTERDPYNITKGWWYAHIGWMFDPPLPFDSQTVHDLLKNRLLVFQDKYAMRLSILANFLVFLGVGWLLGDYVGSFVMAVFVRLLMTYHATWFVNSAAHSWGERTFSKEISPVDNFLLGPISLGEGAYHNYHHTFPSDYRNSYRWFHPDPTKWFIWTLLRLRLVTSAHRTDEAMLRRRLVEEDTKLILQTLSDRVHIKTEEWRIAIQARSAELQHHFDRIIELRLQSKKREARQLRRALRKRLHEWHMLCLEVLRAMPSKIISTN